MSLDDGPDGCDKSKAQDVVEMDIRLDGWDLENANPCDVDTEGAPESPALKVLPDGNEHLCPQYVEQDGAHPLDPALKQDRPSSNDAGEKLQERKKRKRADKGDTGTDDDESCKERGGSRSAVASRKLKESLKTGQFVVNEQKKDAFEERCRQMDDGVKFRYGEKWEVLHQKCGKWTTMAEPYNTTRFKSHLDNCRSRNTKGHNGCISDFFKPQTKLAGLEAPAKNTKPITTARRQVIIHGRSVNPHLETPPIIAEFLPCLGLREVHNNRIPIYISRALTEGAGSQTDSHITAKIFGDGMKYSELGDKGKQLVQASQVHSRAWTISRELHAIYSTNCQKATSAKSADNTCSECLGVLRLQAFKKALKVKPASLASKKFISHQWRTAATDLAINLAEINGLPGLLEAVSQTYT